MEGQKEFAALQAQIREAAERKARKCWEEIIEVCNRHDCELVGVPQISPQGTIVTRIIVQPRQQQ